MEKQRAAFPHPANSVAHSSIRREVIHIAHNAEGGRTHPLPTFYLNILLGININLAYAQYGNNQI